jgi:hypothetical protein
MRAFVVDTNVPVVANGRSKQTDPDCVIACVGALTEVRDSGIIVLDDAMLILDEYRRRLNMSGQPGVGDLFMKWVWSVQAVVEHCRQVHITPRQNEPGNFEEFPDDPELARFDYSDRKFVAVARASGDDPVVLNAVDPDWAEHYEALSRHGIKIRFLCPQHVCRPV